ncbi:acyl-CoA dehydrogenase domain protein [Dinoroseobacter shibae DFL 12 = DSM 16493]|jgi:alkylation response protein AidB-like acyl-CoA dehydrogenase|uniref:Acyl-CoA dehydrogenase domain protein n=1 Tax=Dinoroseobacter shibae (strain DSM 16493 / NCIMB 14021 / DFL 12) TaxID=398580 RepID=A8LSI6_DINSH|nr:acyl-CoA dehydrogenase family protein [Dinoroseobacter shibae]ABV92800.1 acyl-CoA dehydrogenase domain protein [Dinoroseobacter shibae DFL 12 = DSM 16493]URF47742.1 acyl-CoA/acyl-ACP dehydrogenase [Dinoroseobacter shibae]URF52052.1 acyl-CoA/acyl-ACP dehydrogenase [Dinoroseobacter shibae]
MNQIDTNAISMPVGPQWPDIREAVTRLCADFPNDYWNDLDKRDAYPAAFVKALTEAGFLGALIPEAYGGSGLPLSAAGAVLETIHETGCNAAACHAQMYTMGTVLRYGSEAQKQSYLPGIATGDLRLQAFGVTEPTTGSDTTQLKTRAEKTEKGTYLVNGQKVWTSRAMESDLMLLLARTTPADQCTKRSDGMSVFLLDMRDALGNGLELRKIDAMINHNSCEVFLDNLEIPADTLIGEEGRGFRYIVDSMNAERILIAYECIGDAKFFIRKAVEYANERVVFGKPIGANQGLQFPIADAYAKMCAAELMVNKAAAIFDAGGKAAEEANMAKLLAADASWAAAEVCMQTYGGFAFAREYGIERKWREARLYQTAPISKNMIFGYLGQHVLGLPRSY